MADLRFPRLLPLLAAVAALLAASLAPPPADAARRAVPRGWIGAFVGDDLLARPPLLAAEVARMPSAGVESIRVTFSWASAQPYGRWNEIPLTDRRPYRDVGGVPTDFSGLDAIVAAAARHRLSVLPVVLDAPPWDARPSSAFSVQWPRQPGPYARFLTALVRRYGPRGRFWAEHRGLPRRPLRRWQVWNEPDFRGPRWPGLYMRLLRPAAHAIRAADRGARVVLAAVTNRSWESLGRLYRAGARRYFDLAAINAYTRDPRNVPRLARLARRVMTRHGDRRKPLLLTEVGWPASVGRGVTSCCDFSVTEPQLARDAPIALRALARARRPLGIGGIFWFTWLSSYSGSTNAFAYAGLRWLDGSVVRSKPVLATFGRAARRLEGRR